MAVAANETALIVHAVASGAFHATHMRIMRIVLLAGSLLGQSFVGNVTLQANLLVRSLHCLLIGMANRASQARM